MTSGLNVSTVSASCNASGMPTIYERYGGDLAFYDKLTIQPRLERVILPVWIVLGLPGSLISLTVWLNRRMRFSSSVYLAALALNDLLFLLLQIPWYLQESWSIKVVNMPVMCEAYPVVTYALQYSSTLLTLGFTVERFISVYFPFRHEALCTVRRAQVVTGCIFFFAFALSSIQAYFYKFDPVTGTCGPRKELYGSLNEAWTTWAVCTELLLFAVVPFAILVLNIKVIVEMRRIATNSPAATVSTSSSHNGGHRGNSSATRQAAATTFMLLCISFYMIFATLPVTVAYVLFFQFQPGDQCVDDEQFAVDQVWQAHLTFYSVRAVIDGFARSHYAAKFYIYMTTGRQFRRQFFTMYCPSRLTVGRSSRPGARTKSAGVSYTAGVPLVNAAGPRRANGRRARSKERPTEPLSPE